MNIKNLNMNKKIASIGLAFTLLSMPAGSTIAYGFSFGNDNSKTINFNDTELEQQINSSIPNNVDQKISSAELGNLRSLELTNIDETIDLSFLNYCDNLESLSISGSNINFDGIERLNNLRCLSIDDSNYTNLEDLSFFDKDQLEKLSVTSSDIYNYYCLNDFKALKDLNICVFSEANVNFSDILKLENLENLTILSSKYALPIYLTPELCEVFKAKGINLTIYDTDIEVLYENYTDDDLNRIYNEFISVSNDIDNMIDYDYVRTLSDKDKVRYATHLVLKTLTPKVLPGPANSNQANEYYGGGRLKAVFENEDQICGNYSALFQAICLRIGVPCYYVSGSAHAWNMVKIDSDYYYVDTHSLDSYSVEYPLCNKYSSNEEVLRDGTETELEELNDYMTTTSKYRLSAENLPNNLGISRMVLEEEPEYLFTYNYKRYFRR